MQNSQSLYLLIYIQQLKFIFKKYINSHLTMYFLFTNIFTHIYEMQSFTFNGLYSFTFTIEILVQHGAIFIQHFLRTAFAHHRSQLPLHNFWTQYGGRREDCYMNGKNKDHDSSNRTNLALNSVTIPEVFRTRYSISELVLGEWRWRSVRVLANVAQVRFRSRGVIRGLSLLLVLALFQGFSSGVFGVPSSTKQG